METTTNDQTINEITYISRVNNEDDMRLRLKSKFEGWRMWEDHFEESILPNSKIILEQTHENIGNEPDGIYGIFESRIAYFNSDIGKTQIPEQNTKYFWRTDKPPKNDIHH